MRVALTGMNNQNGQNERIEALRTLITQLSAPDLSLAEAKVLRCRLFELLEPAEGLAIQNQTTSAPTLAPYLSNGDRSRQNLRAPKPTMWAAG
jgi:hypothetical protein